MSDEADVGVEPLEAIPVPSAPLKQFNLKTAEDYYVGGLAGTSYVIFVVEKKHATIYDEDKVAGWKQLTESMCDKPLTAEEF